MAKYEDRKTDREIEHLEKDADYAEWQVPVLYRALRSGILLHEPSREADHRALVFMGEEDIVGE